MTNEIADRINTFLATKHARVYRNRSIASPTYPYVVFRLDVSTDTYPTKDYSLKINVIDKNDGTVSVRPIEDLADAIDAALNTSILESNNYKLHFTRDLRQYDDDQSLSGVQLINLQYAIRVY